MRLVVLDLEVVHGEVLDVVHLPLELDGGKGHRLTFELNFEGIDVVGVHVSVAQSVDELASFEAWKNKAKKKCNIHQMLLFVKIRIKTAVRLEKKLFLPDLMRKEKLK
jgi:hypothetical protein